MVTFPTLSVAAPYAWDESPLDTTLRSETEGGYEFTRARHTRVRRNVSAKWRGLTLADKALLDTCIDDMGVGADSTQITAPDDTVWTVRLTAAPKWSPMEPSANALWHLEMELRQV